MIQNENFSYCAWEYIGSFVAVKIPRLFSRFYLGVSFGVSMGVVAGLFVPRLLSVILNFLFAFILTPTERKKMMNKNHNKTSIEAFMDEDGRVKISPEVMKLLKPRVKEDEYISHTIKDKHLLGFRAIAHKGGL